jgi:hypothetical protein
VQADRVTGLVLDDVVSEAVRAKDDVGRRHGMPAGVGDDPALVADHDPLHERAVDIGEAIGVLPFEPCEDLLDEQARVGTALHVGQDRPVAVVGVSSSLLMRRWGTTS